MSFLPCIFTYYFTPNQRKKMKNILKLSLCIAMLLATPLFAIDGANFAFNAKTDKHPLQYDIDEPMVFTFVFDLKGQELDTPLTVEWTRTGDDGLKETGTVVYDGETPATMTTKLGCNGFVRVYAKIKLPDGQYLKNKDDKDWFFDGGAGVHPELLTSTPEPEDFDEFWAKQKARLDKVPIIAEMTEVSKSDVATIYVVSVLCAGPRPVTGILAIPLGAAEGKKYRAGAEFHGYGYGGAASFQKIQIRKSADSIIFSVNAHGVEYQRDDTYYEAFGAAIKQNGAQYAFDKEVNSDPEVCYFNGMALRVMRALQFLKTLDAWNGQDLYASGGSQGGLQTLWAAALDPDVTSAHCPIPWCCDIGGRENYNRNFGSWHIPYTRALDYYDSMNMAKRIHCPVNISRAGLGDYTCPPSGIAIMYNNLKGKKSITWVQGSEHGYTPENAEKFLLEEE